MEEEEELSVDVSNIFKSIQTACDELTQRGQEYLLISADPVSQSCLKIGSDKGRQFLDVNSEVVINFFSYCFGAQIIEDYSDETNNQLNLLSNTELDTSTNIDHQNDETQEHPNTCTKTQQYNLSDVTQPNQVDADTTPKINSKSNASSVLEESIQNDQLTNLAENNTMQNDEEQQKVCLSVPEIAENKKLEQVDEPEESVILPVSDNLSCFTRDQLETQEGSETQKNHDELSKLVTQVSDEMGMFENTNQPESGNNKTDKSTFFEEKGHGDNICLKVPDQITIVDTPGSCNDIKTYNITLLSHEKSNERVKLFENSKNISKQLEQKSLPVDQSISTPNSSVKTARKIRNKTVGKNKGTNGKKFNQTEPTSTEKPTPKPKKSPKMTHHKDKSMTFETSFSSPSKPTCSVCKATFSRIHSLKGHMLIIHQMEVSLEDLQKVDGKSQSSSEDNTSKQGTGSVSGKDLSNDQQRHTLEKKTSFKLTPTQKTKSEISEPTLKDVKMNLEETVNDTIFGSDILPNEPLVEGETNEEIQVTIDKSKLKRTVDNITEGKETKKIKLENTETDADENDIIPLTQEDLENTLNNQADSQLEAKKVKSQSSDDRNNAVVLEENHDENVPKVKQTKKRQDKQVYCDICDKFFQRPLNLTIHNIRFHPSKIMQEFGVDVNPPLQIKQEVVDHDLDGSFDPEDGHLEESDNQQENKSTTIQADDEVSDMNVETLLEPKERLNEIKENDQIKKYINIMENENSLLISCNNCKYSCDEFHQVLVHIARSHPDLSADLDVMMNCFYGIRIQTKKCDECSRTFKSMATLWNHILEEHPYSVENCSKRKRLHHLIKKYKSKKSFVRCEICKEHFRSLRARDKHMLSEHPEVGKKYGCPQCSQAFSTKPNLTRHFRQIHLDEKKFICDICGKSFKQKETLKYHRTTHEKDKPRNFECHICHKRLRKKETLQIHLRQHEGIKPYICEFCGMSFTQNGNRNKHVQLIHNDIRSLECTKCGKFFKLQEHLKRHMKMHLIREGEIPPDKTYNCDFSGCMARYATSAQLKVHIMSKHTNERPWSCDTCGKGFTTKDKLMKHSQTHTGGLFNCNICHKKLPNQESLNFHNQYHDIGNEVGQFEESYETVIIPQESGLPIKVQLAHSEPIITETTDNIEAGLEEGTYYIQTTKSVEEVEEDVVQVEDNTILVDPSVLESVLGATSDEQTVYYYVTGN